MVQKDILKRVPKQDVAFTLQQVTFELVKKHVYPLKTSDNLCIAGGVAYNGYINEEFTKHYTNIQFPPLLVTKDSRLVHICMLIIF